MGGVIRKLEGPERQAHLEGGGSRGKFNSGRGQGKVEGKGSTLRGEPREMEVGRGKSLVRSRPKAKAF